jgi:protein HOOK3
MYANTLSSKSELKASLVAINAKDDEPLKQQNAHMQQQVLQLQEQINELQIKIQKAKEVKHWSQQVVQYCKSNKF